MEILLRVPNLNYVLQGEDTVNFKVNTATIATNVALATFIDVVDVFVSAACIVVVDDADVGVATAAVIIVVVATATIVVADVDDDDVDVAAAVAFVVASASTAATGDAYDACDA